MRRSPAGDGPRVGGLRRLVRALAVVAVAPAILVAALFLAPALVILRLAGVRRPAAHGGHSGYRGAGCGRC